jgi:hypothetical protein
MGEFKVRSSFHDPSLATDFYMSFEVWLQSLHGLYCIRKSDFLKILVETEEGLYEYGASM